MTRCPGTSVDIVQLKSK